jgi:hypothetical protein
MLNYYANHKCPNGLAFIAKYLMLGLVVAICQFEFQIKMGFKRRITKILSTKRIKYKTNKDQIEYSTYHLKYIYILLHSLLRI